MTAIHDQLLFTPSRQASLGGSRQAEHLLLRRLANGDSSVRADLIEHFTPLACRLASRYRETSQAREDLEQVACVGLIKAIDRFDPEKGPFVRYAVPTILGELRRHFRDNGWDVHVPRALQERYLKINRARDRLEHELGRTPKLNELAQALDLRMEEVAEGIDAGSSYAAAQLDAPCGGDPGEDRTLAARIGDIDPRFEYVMIRDSVAPVFAALPERERRIIRLRFVEDLTQAEIAARVGISQMHVSRLLRRALDALSSAVERDVA